MDIHDIKVPSQVTSPCPGVCEGRWSLILSLSKITLHSWALMSFDLTLRNLSGDWSGVRISVAHVFAGFAFSLAKLPTFGIWVKYLSKAVSLLLLSLLTNSRLEAYTIFLPTPASGDSIINLKSQTGRDTTKPIAQSSCSVAWVGWRTC